MRIISIYLYTLVLSNVLFILFNRKFLMSLSRRMVSSAEAAEICLYRGATKLVLKGTIIGLLEEQDKRLVPIQPTTLDNNLNISLNKKCKYVLSKQGNLAYGARVLIQGTVGIVNEKFVIYDIDTITIFDKHLIAKYFNKRYSVSSIVSLFIVLMLEVIKCLL